MLILFKIDQFDVKNLLSLKSFTILWNYRSCLEMDWSALSTETLTKLPRYYQETAF